MKTKHIKKLFLFLLLFTSALTFTLFSCSSPTQPPQKNNGVLTLSLEETSSTEAWIKLKTQNVPLPAEINILMDNKALTNITLTSANTTVYIDSLLPNRSYRMEAQFTDNTGTAKSNPLTVTTLDTTSHNFTWQTFTFGDAGAGSSMLNDVAIIDENNIWAVGEIYMNDSTGKPDPHAYSIVHWDGSKWELKKLYYRNSSGDKLVLSNIRGIFYLNSEDIWFAAGSIFHWDDISTSAQLVYSRLNLPYPNSTIEKLWGYSGSFIYGVGNAGTIVFYNGSTWQKMESGTNTDIKDIWGTTNQASLTKVLAIAYSRGETRILSLTSNNVKDTLNWPANRILIGIWTYGMKTYVSGAEIWENNNNNWKEVTKVGAFYSRIRGNQYNNIFGVGAGGIIHFNGSSWGIMQGTPANMAYRGVDVKNNKMATVGYLSNGGLVGQAAIIIGTLNN